MLLPRISNYMVRPNNQFKRKESKGLIVKNTKIDDDSGTNLKINNIIYSHRDNSRDKEFDSKTLTDITLKCNKNISTDRFSSTTDYKNSKRVTFNNNVEVFYFDSYINKGFRNERKKNKETVLKEENNNCIIY